MKKYDVVIIGAGTSGLSARREVAKVTDNYIVVDDGPLGTTCARVGCMPSKVLIQVGEDFSRRLKLSQEGILGGENLTVDHQKVMEHVRSLRDRFVRSVKGGMEGWQSKLVRGRAKFVDAHTLDIAGELVHAEKVIIATGSRPIIPGPWLEYKESLIDTDGFFELPQLPKKMAVIGLGVIGLELGQALSRLGVEVIGITNTRSLGGLTDPALQDYVIEKMSKELPIEFCSAEFVGYSEKGLLRIKTGDRIVEVEKALVAIGRRPNIDSIGLDKLNIALDSRGLPEVNKNTMKLKELPHIFLPGDANADRPILHEAADEGIIAGHNAVYEEQCFRRRTPLAITFSEPSIAIAGQSYHSLKSQNVPFVTGRVSFEGQGRSIVKLKEQGLLHVYAEAESGKILGAEMHGPDAEHLAHLLAWSISLNLTVFEALKLPFYHPVIEEGLRTALREAALEIKKDRSHELFRCNDVPIR